MKPKDNFLEDLLIVKDNNKPEENGKIFPLGYTDKREVKKKKRKHKKSRNSSKSGSSESIEEKNEELEDDNNKNINDKNENENEENKNDDFFTDNNLKKYVLNEDDSDSEIVEEEIISEEILAQIYKNVENNEENINTNNIVISPITPISETIIKKEEEEDNKIEVDIKEEEGKEQKKKKNEKIVKKRENLLFKYFNHKSLIGKLRIITLVVLIIYILLNITSIIAYIYKKEKKTIFCFEFLDYSNNNKTKTEEKENREDNNINNNNNNENNNNERFFLSGLNSFILVNSLLLFVFISILSTLIKNEYLQLKQFFKGMSLYFPFTLVLNMPIFIIGIIQDKYNDEKDPKIWTPIFFSILTFLGTILMGFVLIRKKQHKYKSISSLINISVLCSFLTAFECYSFIYCICFLIRSYFIKSGNSNVELMSVPEIVAGVAYFAIGFFITTALKDIYFSFIVVIIEIGLLYVKKKYSNAVAFLNIITTFFTFASMIVTIFKYKKKVFGLTHVD
jgi:hypothetical protein